jgi:hypothetical protein
VPYSRRTQNIARQLSAVCTIRPISYYYLLLCSLLSQSGKCALLGHHTFTLYKTGKHLTAKELSERRTEKAWKDSVPTSSTTSTDRWLPPSHLGHPRTPELCHKSVPSLLMCLICKIPTTTTERSESVPRIVNDRIMGLGKWTYLCGNVGDGGRSDGGHAMDAGVTRPCRLDFFLYRTGWGEYVFECLWVTELAIQTSDSHNRDGTHIN